MDMWYMWFTFLAGLCALPAVLRTLCPYFVQDCAYMLHVLRCGARLELYKRRTRFYSILDCFLDAVRKHPHKPFIHFMGETHSYSEVDRESNKVAHALQKVAGLKEGDIVALLIGNEPCFIWTWLGLAKLGCATALLNFNIRSKSLLHCFSCCGANVLLVTPGLPKAATVTHERVWAASFIQRVSGVTSEDVFYLNLPLYHSAGFLIGFTGCIERGNTFVLRRKFSASQFWDDCRKYNVAVMQYIGETMRYLCNTPKRDDDRDHKVKIAIGNGVRPDVWKEFLNRFGNIYVRELYAATEGNIGFINYTTKVGVVGRVNHLHKKIFPYALIKFDIGKEEPVRNADGLCVLAARGEPGLLVGKITTKSPFVGYAGNKLQTEKKRLRDVFVKGDLYFNSGDLLRIDHEKFVYFQDRVGDTFRWKGENVATTEVADILSMVDCIEEANVYGVSVKGHEGRIGMAAVVLKEGKAFDGVDACRLVTNYLPVYARPRFIRIQSSLELTGTFKMKKVKLVKEGFDPALIRDPLYFLDLVEKKYITLTKEMYNSMIIGDIKL